MHCSPILQLKTMRLRDSKVLAHLVNVGARLHAQVLGLQSTCALRCAGQRGPLKLWDYPQRHSGCPSPRTVHRAPGDEGPHSLFSFSSFRGSESFFISEGLRAGPQAGSPCGVSAPLPPVSSKRIVPASKASNGREARCGVPGHSEVNVPGLAAGAGPLSLCLALFPSWLLVLLYGRTCAFL